MSTESKALTFTFHMLLYKRLPGHKAEAGFLFLFIIFFYHFLHNSYITFLLKKYLNYLNIPHETIMG